MKIRKAILPVAGFGTRFLPATKAQPKEMLPIFDTPAIEFIVRELVEAGITDIILITGRGKRAIEDHFDRNFELESALAEKGKKAELELVRGISGLANFAFVRQEKPLGDGHALLCAKRLIGGDEPVLVCFGDDLVDNPNGKNAAEQLLQTFEKTKNPTLLLEKVAPADISKYGIVDFKMAEKGLGIVSKIVEKPAPSAAPSDLGIIGKFVLTPEIFDHLERIDPGPDGEIRLTAAFSSFLSSGGEISAQILDGVRFDTGDKLGFLKATLHFALQKEPRSVATALREFLVARR